MLVHFCNAPLVAVGVIFIFTFATIKSLKSKHFLSLNSQFVTYWFVVPFLFLFVLSYWVPVFIERYLMFLTTALYLLMAIAVDYLDLKQSFKYLIPIIFCAFFLFTTDAKNSNKRHVIETIDKIKELKTENSILYISPEWFDLNFVYYYKLAWFQEVEQKGQKVKLHDRLKDENIYFIEKGADIDSEKVKHFEKVLFLDAGSKSFSSNNQILETIENSGKLSNQYKFYEIFTIYEYSIE